MPEARSVHRAVSAMRTALAGHPMLRFDAVSLIGPSPRAGRVVERVEASGRTVDVHWDDNMVMRTQLKLTGTWHVYRRGERWRRSMSQMSAAIEVEGWIAVCFGAASTETYRLADKRRHPGAGRLGPDLVDPGTDLATVVNLLMSYTNEDARLCDVLLDQRVMRSIGNAYRSEVMWAREISPFAPIGDLRERDAIGLVNTAATMVRAAVHDSASGHPIGVESQHRLCAPAVYGRNGQECRRCGETIDCRPTGPYRRMLFWCPGCQHLLDPSRPVDPTMEIPLPAQMDPHPAARAFIADLPWNRVS